MEKRETIGKCDTCSEIKDLRPMGEDDAWICHGCMSERAQKMYVEMAEFSVKMAEWNLQVSKDTLEGYKDSDWWKQ